MNLPVLLSGLVAVLATAAAVWLYLRLKKQKALFSGTVPDGLSHPAVSPSGLAPADYDSLAIDHLLYDKVCRYMTERRPFLVESFSLQDLAGAMCTNKAYLSKTINHYSGKNFRQYVNYYRIMYSMDLFRNNMSLRVSELAVLSGFHSPTSYFQSFKVVMGEPPSSWCARLRVKATRRK
jgi:AraC-like DNA-binding protein